MKYKKNKMFFCSTDIGSSKIAVTISNNKSPILRLVQPTNKKGSPETIGFQCLNLIKLICKKIDIKIEQILSLGVSSCGPFAKQDGKTVLIAPNLCGGLTEKSNLPNKWTSIPLESILMTCFKDIKLINDCIAALHGEKHFGAAHNVPNCIYVTWSTGVGFGICVDGSILEGKNGNAGHAGHMLLSENSNFFCECGNNGDLEGLTSGYSLFKKYKKNPIEIFSDAKNGDKFSIEILKNSSKWFGRGLYNLITCLDISKIILGGSIWRNNKNFLLPLLRAEIDGRFSALTDGVVIQNAYLDELVTDIGATSIVLPMHCINEWKKNKPWKNLKSIFLDL
tara:strand:- start:531 stop:1541 length:1011 start_codon:yes stop_codon:yes gene_type:complete